MAKLKPAGGRKKSTAPRGGYGCIVLLVLGMLLVILFLIYVMGQYGSSS
jgi:hypothetical protein